MNRAVLYIEDNADNVRLVERLLRRRPQILLRVATTGGDGVRAAIAEPPALILLDNRLPDATGHDVLRQLASSADTAGIPVIVISGDSAGALAELVAVGASDFLPKPFDIHELISMIDRYLG